MAAKTIHQFPSTTIASTDELPIWDVSTSSTKKITALNLVSLIANAQSIMGFVYADPDGTVTDHGDTAQTGSIANLCTTAAGAAVCIVCAGPKSFPFLTTYSIPANAMIVMLPGAQAIISVNVTIGGRLIVADGEDIAFNIASAKVLTINGQASIGHYQIFTGAGTVTFGALAVEEIYPEWWGISGTDDTASVQAAINSAPTDGSGFVKLPPTNLKFNVTIAKEIRFEGGNNDITGHYYQPYTDANPVITMGSVTTNYNGIKVRNMPLHSGASGQKGISIGNGAVNPVVENVSLVGFSNYAIDITLDPLVTATSIGHPLLRTVYINCGAGNGIKANGVSFYLQSARINGTGNGPGHVMDLTDSICYMDRAYIQCHHDGGVILRTGTGSGSSIWRSGGDIIAARDALFTLQYIGSGSAATVSITDNDGDLAPDLLTTTCTGAGGDNLSINLNSYATITDLVNYINTTYSATYTAVASVGSADTLDLNLITGITDIKASALGLYANVGLENPDSTELSYYSWIRGLGWSDLGIKNKNGITCDCGGEDLRAWIASLNMARVNDLTVSNSFAMTDANDKPCNVVRIFGDNAGIPVMANNSITAVHDTGASKWYLVIDFAGTSKKVELT